jgi:uncharacterized protein YhaN
MRFAELTLERYGRFEDCRLEFVNRDCDLHIVLGGNEAGKTTTLAAISDLLFGFGTRSPYNFRFDYPLLRIGAVLEEDEQRFTCRRKKSQSGSLIGTDEQPLSEGPLLSLLRGQTRETFHLGFSLDQTRLREGGRAMVDARDDLGRAMFAAGSGMTGVSDVLNALDAEANAIWGPRAAAWRRYTIAEREFTEASRKVRDDQLRPRTWSEARDARDQRQADLKDLEDRRGELTAERVQIDRLRRVGPHIRRRDDLMAEMESYTDAVTLSPEAEELAGQMVLAAEKAERERAAAAVLLGEVTERIAAIGADPDVIADAGAIEALLEQRGAIQKARKDLGGLEGELRAARTRVEHLGRDLGGFAGEPPSRIAVARLRALAVQYAEEGAAHRAAGEVLAATESSIAEVEQRVPENDPVVKVQAVAPAVEAARKLGGDIDERCADLVRRAEAGRIEADAALGKLRPWTGSFADLVLLTDLSEEEITSAQSVITQSADQVRTELSEIERLREELERLQLRREAAERSGLAVSAEAVEEARQGRDRLWGVLRDHLSGEEQVEDPVRTGEQFERSIGEADSRVDARFASAEGSAQLAQLAETIADLNLQRDQAGGRKTAAEAEHERVLGAWKLRLKDAGLPELGPAALRGWIRLRSDALRLNSEAASLEVQSKDLLSRREEALRALRAVPGISASGTERLDPMLGVGERVLAAHEAEARGAEADRAELRRLRQEAESATRKVVAAAGERREILAEWDAQRAAAGVHLAIEDAEAGLGLFEELRTAVENAATLERRVASIRSDEQGFAAAVAAVADRLGVPPADEPDTRLDSLRQRLESARQLDTARTEIQSLSSRRGEEVRTAKAAYDAAIAGAADILHQCRLADISALPEAIELSRKIRRVRDEVAEAERQIASGGDGYSLADLEASWRTSDPDQLCRRAQELDGELAILNDQITETADALGDARRAFEALDQGAAAADAAADAAQARAEMDVLAEAYLLKRSEVIILRWAIEKYRERRQDPLLRRASDIFAKLTLGGYSELRVDYDSQSPRLLGLCADGATVVDVDSMSEGTTDQLFLALRLAAVEQSIAAGIRLPFLADDLFVNFDDRRAAAGFEVLAELARSTQVLFFTHHDHLSTIAAAVIGHQKITPCLLDP